MKKYKLIASDLDGTLFQDDGTVSERNLRAIEAIAAQDVLFVPSSGRTLCEIDRSLVDNAGVRYVIYSNGAAIYDKRTGERTLMGISQADARIVLDMFFEQPTHITIRHNGKTYVDATCQSDEFCAYTNVWQTHLDVVKKFAINVEDLSSFAYGIDQIESFVAFFRTEEERKSCFERLNGIGVFLAVKIASIGLEVFSVQAGKGNALRKLLLKCGVPIEETIAVGDSGNDVSMLQAAGLGLAMQNAPDEVKAIADGIACGNGEHVAEYLLKKYV